MNTSLSNRAAQTISGYNSNKNVMIWIDIAMLAACERAGLFQRKGSGAKRDTGKPGLSHWIYLQMARGLQELEKESM